MLAKQVEILFIFGLTVLWQYSNTHLNLVIEYASNDVLAILIGCDLLIGLQFVIFLC